MAASLSTFIDIFSKEMELDTEVKKLEKIIIPKIQRDYAQGRKDPSIDRVRRRFLKALHQGITEKPVTLDFIYGDIDQSGNMYPLDGQQRLTTLYLLHWYAAKKENVEKEKYEFLKRFSYYIRYSARDFCEKLVDFNPNFKDKLSDQIIDQGWFPLSWKNDPTIGSMLNMLDEIDIEFNQTENIWKSLENGSINFYFLAIKEMGLTDELYIKMNSRGKPLTRFEHFKAEFEREVTKLDPSRAKKLISKIDKEWTDMIWKFRDPDDADEDNLIDDKFLSYFRFICDIISYKSGGTSQGRDYDEFSLLEEFFCHTHEFVEENINYLEKFIDIWVEAFKKSTTKEFFDKFFSYNHNPEKVLLEERYEINVLKDCMKVYGLTRGRGVRLFPLNRIALLYSFLVYLDNENSIGEEEFSRRLRIVNNLIMNSEDELSDSIHRTSGNRMPAIIKQIEYIILNGKVDLSLDNNFNRNQLEEEADKIKWLEESIKFKNSLFKLEDHRLLQGQISILGLENPAYFLRFESLFSCDMDKIDCALLSIGFYGQQDNWWRYQLGSSRNLQAWRNLFHKSSSKGFESTSEILRDLLSRKEEFTNQILDDIAVSYIKKCDEESLYDWRYYYIKYKNFRPGSYGKYNWYNYEVSPYSFRALRTASLVSVNTYNPFLNAIYFKDSVFEDNGNQLIIDNYSITSQNDSYKISDLLNDKEDIIIKIAQNEDGIDVEERIEKFKMATSNLFFPEI